MIADKSCKVVSKRTLYSSLSVYNRCCAHSVALFRLVVINCMHTFASCCAFFGQSKNNIQVKTTFNLSFMHKKELAYVMAHMSPRYCRR